MNSEKTGRSLAVSFSLAVGIIFGAGIVLIGIWQNADKIPAGAVPAVVKVEGVDNSAYVGSYEDKFVKATHVYGRFSEDGPHFGYSITTDKATGARIFCREASGPMALCLLPPVPVEQTTKPLQKGD